MMRNVFKCKSAIFQCKYALRFSSTVNSDNFISPKNKYKLFQDEESPVILDVTEERTKHEELNRQPCIQQDEEISLKRGITGVFDIEELVETLKKDNAQDIFVVEVPKELKYVDFLVIVSSRSRRHLLGLAEYIRSVFKKKRNPRDIIPKIEGENSSEWIAMDLGNIALHIMSKPAREKFDLESLWSVGVEYDTKINCEDDSLTELIKKHSVLLDDLHPKETG